MEKRRKGEMGAWRKREMCAEESRPSEPDPDKRALQDARFQTQHVTW